MNKPLLFAGVLLGAACTRAQAEDFISLAAGASHWPGEACIIDHTCDRRVTAWSARAGHMITPYLGVELRYVDLGRVDSSFDFVEAGSTNVRFDAKGAGAGVLLAYPVVDRLRVTGVAGAARMRTRFHSPDTSIFTENGSFTLAGSDASATKTKPYFGVGLDYAFAPRLSAGVEAMRYRAGFDGNANVDTIMATLGYRF